MIVKALEYGDDLGRSSGERRRVLLSGPRVRPEDTAIATAALRRGVYGIFRALGRDWVVVQGDIHP